MFLCWTQTLSCCSQCFFCICLSMAGRCCGIYEGTKIRNSTNYESKRHQMWQHSGKKMTPPTQKKWHLRNQRILSNGNQLPRSPRKSQTNHTGISIGDLHEINLLIDHWSSGISIAHCSMCFLYHQTRWVFFVASLASLAILFLPPPPRFSRLAQKLHEPEAAWLPGRLIDLGRR